MTAIEGIFFDLDGTFLDTSADFIVTVNQILSDYHRPILPEEVIRRNVSAGSRTLMQIGFELPRGAQLEEKREEFLQYYDRHIKDESRASSARLYPGIAELIADIEQRNIPWGIVTNKPRDYALQLLEQLNLIDRAATIICPDDVQIPKPNPEALFLACQQAKCNPERSLYIGDHIRDIQAGQAAGMHTTAAHYGYIAEGDDPFQWQADLNIDNATELHHWLQSVHWTVHRTRVKTI